MAHRRLIVSVAGGGNAPPAALEAGFRVGQELARRGVVVVTGGLGGVMEAVCRGVRSAGGLTVALLPGHRHEEANPYVDIPIPTGMGYARNVIVAKAGDVLIAIDGAYGTLSEIAHALGEEIPVVGLDTWDLAIQGQPDRAILRVRDPVEAVDRALELADRRAHAHLHREEKG